MVKFQTGAFALGCPVLPILLRYPYKHFNPAWNLADLGKAVQVDSIKGRVESTYGFRA